MKQLYQFCQGTITVRLYTQFIQLLLMDIITITNFLPWSLAIYHVYKYLIRNYLNTEHMFVLHQQNGRQNHNKKTAHKFSTFLIHALNDNRTKLINAFMQIVFITCYS